MNIITTQEQLDEMVAEYMEEEAFCFDVETVGDRRGDTPVNQVLWISLATEGRADVIPMGHPNGELISVERPLTGQGQKRVDAGLPARDYDYSRNIKLATKIWSEPPAQLTTKQVFDALKPLLYSSKVKVGHNLIFDLTSVAKYYKGEVPPAPYFDTMIASFMYDNANKNKCGLKDCLKREFGFEMEKGVGAEVEAYSFMDVAKYSYLDAKYTWLLYKKLKELPKFHAIGRAWELEMDVLWVLCQMKLTGAPIDTDALADLDQELKDKIEEAKAKVFKAAGRQFNLNSNAEKQELLFAPKSRGGRGLKSKKKTAGGADSVSADVLEEYRGEDDLVDALLNYTELTKLHGTYVVPYLGGEVIRTSNGKAKVEVKNSLLINGRVHGDFIQHGAETGRFSSRNPNLQNVPNSKTDLGKAIRNLFYAPEGYKLVVADYSQIEPRLIAHFTKDEILLNTYANGEDVYTTLGGAVGLNRAAGKVLVLAMSYGVGPDKISRSLGIDLDTAKKVLNDFLNKFPAVNSYKNLLIGAAKNRAKEERTKPYISTLSGRRRYLPELESNDRYLRSAAERQAFNTKIQGSAADIMKIAMINAYNMVPEGGKLLLTVHDELVVLTPDHLASETAEAVKAAMESIGADLNLRVPLIAEVGIAQRWGDAK